MTARILDLPETTIDVSPEQDGSQTIPAPDVTGARWFGQGASAFWSIPDPRCVLVRRGVGVYQVHDVRGNDLTTLLDQAVAHYTLAEWLSDPTRRSRWDGLNADHITLAGRFYPGELGSEAEAVDSTAVVDDRSRLITMDDGDPVHTE